jgi:hypothetical protein
VSWNLPNWLIGRPKREMSPFGHVVAIYVVSIRYEGHGVQHRPKVTKMDIWNGETRQVLSQVKLEQATRP